MAVSVWYMVHSWLLRRGEFGMNKWWLLTSIELSMACGGVALFVVAIMKLVYAVVVMK